MPDADRKLVSLVPHPVTPPRAVGGIRAGCHLTDDGRLRFTYRIEAARERLSWIRQPVAGRRDELWRHTCCEAFVATGPESYLEFNFAPDGSWAAYAFTAYRRRGRAEPVLEAPAIRVHFGPQEMRLEAAVAWRGPGDDCRARGLRMGLAGVVEEAGGPTSYWALRHPRPQPDFHDADAFVLEVPAARWPPRSGEPAA